MKRLLSSLEKRGFNTAFREDESGTFVDVTFDGTEGDYIQVEFIEHNGVKGTLFDDGNGSMFIESRKVDDVAKTIKEWND